MTGIWRAGQLGSSVSSMWLGTWTRCIQPHLPGSKCPDQIPITVRLRFRDMWPRFPGTSTAKDEEGLHQAQLLEPFTVRIIFLIRQIQRDVCMVLSKNYPIFLAICCLFSYPFIQRVHHELVRNILLNLDRNSKIDVSIIRTRSHFYVLFHSDIIQVLITWLLSIY